METPAAGRASLVVLALLVPLASLASTGCGLFGSKRDAPPGPAALVRGELGGMTNYSIVGELSLGGGPSADDLELAARRGVVRIIDLCRAGELDFDVEAVCAAHGMEYVGLPIGPSGPSDEDVDRLLGVLRAGAERHTLMFSKSGSEAAMLFAIHRAVNEGFTVDDALAEGRRAGMKPGRPEDLVREQWVRRRPS